MMSDW